MEKVEKDKNYRMWLEGWTEKFLLVPIGNHQIYPRNSNFRYTHYINSWGCNLNQLNVDYINDCLKFDQPIPVSLHLNTNKIGYYKIKSIVEC